MLRLSIQGITTACSYLWCTCCVLLADGSHLTLLLFCLLYCVIVLANLWLNVQLSYSTIFLVRGHRTQKSSSSCSDNGFERSWNTLGCLSLLMYVSINRCLCLDRNYRKNSSHVIPRLITVYLPDIGWLTSGDFIQRINWDLRLIKRVCCLTTE